MLTFGVIVHGFVQKGNQYLFTKRRESAKYGPGLWDNPGGRLEIGESPEEGLVREALEETGLRVEVIRPVAVFSKVIEEMDKHFITLVYLCRYVEGEVVLSDEHTQYRWATKEEAAQLTLVDYLAQTLDML